MDDPYPQEGSSFYIPEAPEETKQQLEDERSQSALASPFIEGVMTWFDDQVVEFDSISFALYEAEARGVEVPDMLNALNICKNKFSDKKAEFDILMKNIKTQ